MRKCLTLLIILLIYSETKSQVLDLSKSASQRKIIPVEYDGTYLYPDYGATKEMKAGLVGQKITIIDIYSEYSFTDNNGNNASYNDLNNIEGKIWTIEEFINDDRSGKFKIKNEDKEWIAELSSLDKWYINKGLENLKTKFIGKKYNSFLYGQEIESVDESKFKLDGNNPITVSDLQFAKLSLTEYSIVLIFDNGLITPFTPWGITQPKEEGWIKVGGDYGEDLLVEVTTLNKYSVANPKFIKQMRNRKVEIGMTEFQTRLAWGIPNKGYKNLAGYDQVNDYGQNKLYFKKNILQLIK